MPNPNDPPTEPIEPNHVPPMIPARKHPTNPVRVPDVPIGPSVTASSPTIDPGNPMALSSGGANDPSVSQSAREHVANYVANLRGKR